MTLSYDEVFRSFLGNITDYKIASMTMQDAYDMMVEWLHKAFSKPYVRRLFSSSILDDTVQTFSFEMSYEVDENSDKDFAIDVLAKGMVIEWVQPQVKSGLNIAQGFFGKEQKFYSQQAHLSELRGLLEDTQLEQRKIIRDRGYIYNPYLEG